jgi:hypothetical protein
MERRCTNCNTSIINESITPNLVSIFENFYGEHWDNEVQDISMEICSICGTLPELLDYIEKELSIGKNTNFKNIIQEFDDNLHVPFLLQIAAPIFIFIMENAPPTIQKAAIDELGTYGDEDSIGRFVLAHQNNEIRILGLRALEKIAKHEQKRGKKLNWSEYLDYMIVNDLDLLKKIKESVKAKNFLKAITVKEIMPILDLKESKMTKKLT